jgi:hypothetical protein
MTIKITYYFHENNHVALDRIFPTYQAVAAAAGFAIAKNYWVELARSGVSYVRRREASQSLG